MLPSHIVLSTLSSSDCLDHPSPRFPFGLLVPPASLHLLQVPHPSIFFLGRPLLLLPSPCASIIHFSNPSDSIACPKNPSFLLSTVRCSVSSSSIPISIPTL